jgi:hypothetical protein
MGFFGVLLEIPEARAVFLSQPISAKLAMPCLIAHGVIIDRSWQLPAWASGDPRHPLSSPITRCGEV